jgi:CPA2 family monovalent cation:H+ antiporter-2
MIVLATQFLSPFISANFQSKVVGDIITTIISLAVMSPFIWALTVKKIHKHASTNLWLDKKYNRGPLVILEVFRNILAVVFLYVLLSQLFAPLVTLGVALLVLVVVLVIFKQRMQLFYTRIERRFLINLNARSIIEGTDVKNAISPWDAHLAYFVINPEANFVGVLLNELKWREKYGINIASIERGKKIIDVPTRGEMLFPNDRIAVIGTDEQLQVFRYVIEPVAETLQADTTKDEVSLHKIIVDNHNKLRGKTIRDSGIREITGGLVVGVERDGMRLINPESTLRFEWDDVIWVVGDWRKIKELIRE